MALQLFLIWYFLIGALLGNGVPHFAFGAAGKAFKTPFSRKSRPKVNILWGLSNFVLATLIAAGLVATSLYSAYALPALLLGFWLMMLTFGFGMKDYLN